MIDLQGIAKPSRGAGRGQAAANVNPAKARSLALFPRLAGKTRHDAIRRRLVDIYLDRLRRLVHRDVTRAAEQALTDGMSNTLLLAEAH
jgi:hypothetical protein